MTRAATYPGRRQAAAVPGMRLRPSLEQVAVHAASSDVLRLCSPFIVGGVLSSCKWDFGTRQRTIRIRFKPWIIRVLGHRGLSILITRG